MAAAVGRELDVFISIHAPHEGERLSLSLNRQRCTPFQSTLPTRGSDRCRDLHPANPDHFNPRSPRGGATVIAVNLRPASAKFQSTLPTRGSDELASVAEYRSIHFNPRSPRGGATLHGFFIIPSNRNFNPRSPRGGATFPTAAAQKVSRISIHAPHEGERHGRFA